MVANKKCKLTFQNKLAVLDTLHNNQMEWNSDLRQNLKTQSNISLDLQKMLENQVERNTAQAKTIGQLESIISSLEKTLHKIHENQNDTANITEACKTIVHSFSLADPFFW